MAYKAAGDENAADEALKSALVIALGLPEPAERIEALARVAIAQADSGDRKAGRETLDQAVWIASQVPSVPGGGTDQTVSAAKARVGDWNGGRQSALGQTDNAIRATTRGGRLFLSSKGRCGPRRRRMDRRANRSVASCTCESRRCPRHDRMIC